MSKAKIAKLALQRTPTRVEEIVEKVDINFDPQQAAYRRIHYSRYKHRQNAQRFHYSETLSFPVPLF